MKRHESRILETLRRIQAYLDANGERFATINGSPARRNLDSMIAEFTAQSVSQISGSQASKGETARMDGLREILRTHYLRAVTTAARLKAGEVPELETITAPTSGATDPQLIAAAGSLAELATKYEATLKDAGLPDGFVDELKVATNSLRQSIDTRDSHLERRAGATAGLKAQAQMARHMVGLIDSLVLKIIGSDPEALGKWKTAKRVVRQRGVVSDSEQSTVVAPPDLPKAA